MKHKGVDAVGKHLLNHHPGLNERVSILEEMNVNPARYTRIKQRSSSEEL